MRSLHPSPSHRHTSKPWSGASLTTRPGRRGRRRDQLAAAVSPQHGAGVRGVGGTLLPWCCSAGRRARGCSRQHTDPRLVPLQRALRGGQLHWSGRRRGAPRPPQLRVPRPKPSGGQRPLCPAPRLRPAPPSSPAPPPAASPQLSSGRGLTAPGALTRQTEVGERGGWEGAPTPVVLVPMARLGQQ